MTLIAVSKRSGGRVDVESDCGSVMEALRSNGVDEILALCGGALACATCHVFVDEKDLAKIPPASADERSLIETSSHFRENSRLSCQIMLSPELKTLALEVAPEE